MTERRKDRQKEKEKKDCVIISINFFPGFDGIPSFVDAAFVWSGNGKIYFFKVNLFQFPFPGSFYTLAYSPQGPIL